MESSHCYNAYFHGSAAALPQKVQGLGQFSPNPCTGTKPMDLESLGFQGFRLCSVRMIIMSAEETALRFIRAAAAQCREETIFPFCLHSG